MGFSFTEDFQFFRNPTVNRIIAGGVTLAFTGLVIFGKHHPDHIEPELYYFQVGNTLNYTLVNSSFI